MGGGCVLPCEAKNMLFAAANTNIPIPKVHRVFNVKKSKGHWGPACFILMDYVNGDNLADTWDSLDKDTRSSIASQVANFISQMQLVSLERPGPIGNDDTLSRGTWFSDYGAGPFQTIQNLEDWCNHKITICKHFGRCSPDLPEFKIDKLVLCHLDITPRNLILDKDGVVCLIDWAHAGGYPPGFEYAALMKQHRYQFKDFADRVAGKIQKYPVVARQLIEMTYGLTTAALA